MIGHVWSKRPSFPSVGETRKGRGTKRNLETERFQSRDYHAAALGCRHCAACCRIKVRHARRSSGLDWTRNEQSRKMIADRSALARNTSELSAA